ncbi:MAG: hypothetical protein FWD57_17030 [Polyangiaceae bacterium]|nr:hypothetical protein [Polyangiaceae bacterium]
MSTNVLIITEDFTHDQHVIMPIVRAMFAEIGRPSARVDMLKRPPIRGLGNAKKAGILRDVVAVNKHVHVFLRIIDRDCDPGCRVGMMDIDDELRSSLAERQCFLSECAYQAIEAWALASADDLPPKWPWNKVRQSRKPKDDCFKEYVTMHGLINSPSRGLVTLGSQAGKRYKRVRDLCGEIKHMEWRVKNFFESDDPRRTIGEPYDETCPVSY